MKNHTSTTRRSFFGKAGAAVAVPLAFGAGSAAAASGDAGSDELKARLEQLESRDAIRALHETFLRHLNSDQSGDRHSDRNSALRTLFSDPRETGPDGAITALRHDGNADGVDSIVVAADGHHATGTFCCIATMATPIAADGTLADMMRLQGSDRIRHEERGVLESRYVKVRGAWKIEQVVYRPRGETAADV